MPAPKGNKFGLGSPGRSRDFATPEDMKNEIDEYFNLTDNDPIEVFEVAGKDPTAVAKPVKRPYTLEGLAIHLKVTAESLRNYGKKDGYEEFFWVLEYARSRINNQNLTYGMAGVYNPKIVSIALNTNSSYREKTQQEINLKTEFKVGFDDELESE